MNPGASMPPETMMHFPLFQIALYFRKIFKLGGKFSKCYLFPKNFSIFIRRLMTFFSHRPQIYNFPLFSLFQYIPPVSRKLLFPPYFLQFPSVLEKITCFLPTLCVFRFPATLTMMHFCIT